MADIAPVNVKEDYAKDLRLKKKIGLPFTNKTLYTYVASQLGFLSQTVSVFMYAVFLMRSMYLNFL